MIEVEVGRRTVYQPLFEGAMAKCLHAIYFSEYIYVFNFSMLG